MSLRPTRRLGVLAATVLWLLAAVSSAAGAPASAPSSGRERLDLALQRYEAARRNAAALDARARTASARLDDVVARQQIVQQRVESQAGAMYRDTNGWLAWLLESGSFDELTARWDMLARIAVADARSLEQLKRLRVEAAARARSLIALQADQARATDALSIQVADAKRQLAQERAALAVYEARTAPPPRSPRPTVATKPAAARPTAAHSRPAGDWKSATASMYGLDFHGRGASGEEIGPYSMIVAHKTLPFGTLIEFEYHGNHAVAKVADRGPYDAGREFDLGPGVARVLGFDGVDTVRYRIIGK